MTVSAKWYGNALLKALNKEVDFDTDTIKVMLCTSSYAWNQNTHIYKSSVTNEVASGGGYTTGGATLGAKTITEAALVTTLGAANTTWSASTITARFAVVYVATGNDATSALLFYIDFGEDKVSSAGDFTIAWNASGIGTITVA